MTTDLVTLRSRSHQETAAKLSIKHKIKAIPVVGENNRFLGVIPLDVILDILHREHIEDVLYQAGVSRFSNPTIELIHASSLDHLKRRLPWLIIGLLGGVLAATIVNGFDYLIGKLILLAAFLPAIVYMGDAVGTQSETIMIRSLAIDRNLLLKNYIWRELRVNSSIGLIIGLSAGIISQIFWGNFTLALIVTSSFFLTILFSSLVAILSPLFFERLKVDPAIGSGPIATLNGSMI